MKESLKHRFIRIAFNFWPCIRGTGAKVLYIAQDWKEIRVKVPLNWRTRNYVGTIFGGSMYGAIDPFLMLMFIKILGKEYIVWDKAATIDFVKPGISTLFATFLIDEKEIDYIRRELKEKRSLLRTYPLQLVDKNGNLVASFQKTLYFRKKI